ncbi:MAG: lysostaphin resistance A-like protein [Candidatus Saccharimonadales bacterium]
MANTKQKKDIVETKKSAPKKASAKKVEESKPTATKITWKTIGWALLMLAWVGIALIASQYIISFILISILGTETVLQPVWSTIYSALVYVLCLFFVVFVPWKLVKMKTNRDELGLTGLPTWTDILLSPVGFFVYFILSAILLALFASLMPGVDWNQSQDVGFQNLISTSDKILAFIALVVIAPIAEEIIFRGWLYGKLRGRMPAWLSIILVSALFGFMHGQWNVAVNVFCMSVVMCLMREITGTIWSSMLLHMIKNGVAFYFLFINPIV